MGWSVGLQLGFLDGCAEGGANGWLLGCIDGSLVGWQEGKLEGCDVGVGSNAEIGTVTL